LHETSEDVLAFRPFPQGALRKIRGTNLLERLNVAPRGALSEAAHQTPHPYRRHLPQRRRDHPPGGRPAAGAAGGVAVGGPPRVLGAVDGQAGQQQRSGPGSTNSCTYCSCLTTDLRSGHRPRDLHHSRGRCPLRSFRKHNAPDQKRADAVGRNQGSRLPSSVSGC